MPIETHTLPLRILIIEDEPDVAATLARVIESCGNYRAFVCARANEVESQLRETDADVVFTDLMMPDIDGFEVLRRVRATAPDVPVVVVSAYATLENAVRAVKMGAFDFLAKPFSADSVDLLLTKLGRDLEHTADLEGQIVTHDPLLKALLGESPAMQTLRRWIIKVRAARANVLIEGESGTGKELVARAIHNGKGSFVALNMAAIPDHLAEAELFGFRKGAFTGADRDKPGILMEAHGGTLFLDEVNAMTPAIQAKLLRVLEERRVRPVGGTKDQEVDFRVIAAANQNLEALVQQGSFRRDLYHRFKLLHVTLAPLRERREDIPLLVAHFVRRYAAHHGCRTGMPKTALMNRLTAGAWPGNVRELENAIEQAVILCPRCPEDHAELPLERFPGLQDGPGPVVDDASLAAVEARHVHSVMARTGGNKSQAARILGIDYKTLLRKL